MSEQPRQLDVVVQDEGTVAIFWLHTDRAHRWVADHVGHEQTWVGPNGLVVEHRFVTELAEGMTLDGLTLDGQ